MNIQHRRLAEFAAIVLLSLPVNASRFDSAVPVRIPRPPEAKRTTRAACSDMAVRVALAKTQAEMRALLPGVNDDPVSVSAVMNSDPRFAEQVKTIFGNSDLIKSEYLKEGKCVVTVQLSLDRLQNLAGVGR